MNPTRLKSRFLATEIFKTTTPQKRGEAIWIGLIIPEVMGEIRKGHIFRRVLLSRMRRHFNREIFEILFRKDPKFANSFLEELGIKNKTTFQTSLPLPD